MKTKNKKILAWLIIGCMFIVSTFVLSSLLVSKPTKGVVRVSYFYRARHYFNILNFTKELIEGQFKIYNQIFGSNTIDNFTFTSEETNLTYKFAKYTGLNAVNGYAYTIVVWCNKYPSGPLKRSLEASFNATTNKIRVKIVYDYFVPTSEESSMVLHNLSSLSEFHTLNNTMKIYVSHSTPSISYYPPFQGMLANFDGAIITISGLAIWPSDISDVGYLDTGLTFNGFTFPSMAGYVYKINAKTNLSNDLTFATGNIFPNGSTDNRTQIDTTLPMILFPSGSGDGTYLGTAWMDGDTDNPDNVPDVYLEGMPEYDTFSSDYSEMTNLETTTLLGEEVYNVCRNISLLNGDVDYIFDNADGNGDTPDF